MLRAGEWLGEFQVLDTLGLSVGAASYRARQRGTGAQVVLKVQERASNERGAATRFVREAHIVRALHHPMLQAVLSVSVDATPRYLALEYVEGRSLRALLSAETPPAIGEAIAVVRQVLDALGYIHAHGVIHRDVKPENILVRPDGSVKLIDFGSARLIGASECLTVSGELAGTPDYAAPEQVVGGAVGPGADLYATGAVLYELLTGAPPFAGDNAAAVLYQKVYVPAPHPRSLRPELSPALDAVVVRALQARAVDRYASAAAMLAALDRTPEGKRARDGRGAGPLERLALRLQRRDRS